MLDARQTESTDYALVAQAIHYLGQNFQEQPSLDDLAVRLNISPFHLQRVFSRWAGISPKRFLQFLTVDYAKASLLAAQSVLDAAYDAGLSGPGRLHDLFVTLEAVTPGEYKSQGAGLKISVGRHSTPFGDCLLATTPRGIVALNFLDPDHSWEQAIDELHKSWKAATITVDPDATAPLIERIFAPQPTTQENGPATGQDNDLPPLRILVKGTNFQIKVWEALLRLPLGAVCTYADIARAIESPKAMRAVGSAIGANSVAYLIPCHRVIRQGGLVSDYRWGATRKRALIGWEAAHRMREGEVASA
ncbi:MAG: methylated-DNA--[protein]-cysteine S-methyltransferase [Caldilineaceae bacterium]|nr:methylated-DNA--[protein]-cysteine S-methyltransferase [Caldilineaceae bacterium]